METANIEKGLETLIMRHMTATDGLPADTAGIVAEALVRVTTWGVTSWFGRGPVRREQSPCGDELERRARRRSARRQPAGRHRRPQPLARIGTRPAAGPDRHRRVKT